MMEDISIFNNLCGDHVFDQFNRLYGEQLMTICPLLRKFRISVLLVNELIESKIITDEDADNQAYLNHIEKTEEDASETRAYIGKDDRIIKALRLTIEEQFACIAHEIGHIIFFFHSNQEGKGGLGEEIIADRYACRLGLKEPLRHVLIKLLETHWYSEELKEQQKKRLSRIDFFY